mmetsp:Transcript_75067/g.208739  ORF Transcript_75067/g.208739 Transcript_75067/m.208739 type:complete len:239 (+) Transcript_75067:1-717(+)
MPSPTTLSGSATAWPLVIFMRALAARAGILSSSCLAASPDAPKAASNKRRLSAAVAERRGSSEVCTVGGSTAKGICVAAVGEGGGPSEPIASRTTAKSWAPSTSKMPSPTTLSGSATAWPLVIFMRALAARAGILSSSCLAASPDAPKAASNKRRLSAAVAERRGSSEVCTVGGSTAKGICVAAVGEGGGPSEPTASEDDERNGCPPPAAGCCGAAFAMAPAPPKNNPKQEASQFAGL